MPACFPALRRGVLAGWCARTTLPLAIAAVTHPDRGVALVIRVRSRGGAIPVAWGIVPAQAPGAGMPHILPLLDHLLPAIPPTWQTVVMVDRGLGSPRLWHHLEQRQVHPLLRSDAGITVRPIGWTRPRTPADVVPHPGRAWIGPAAVFGAAARQVGTLVMVWGVGQKARWVVRTTLASRTVQTS